MSKRTRTNVRICTGTRGNGAWPDLRNSANEVGNLPLQLLVLGENI